MSNGGCCFVPQRRDTRQECLTTAAALLPSCCFADSALCRWSSLFLYLFLFGYSCTSWIELESVQFCGVLWASRMHSGTCTTPVPTDPFDYFSTLAVGCKPADHCEFSSLNFSTIHIFHSTSFDFFSFLFCSRVTHRECQRATFCAFQVATSGRPPVPAIPNRVLEAATDLTEPWAY